MSDTIRAHRHLFDYPEVLEIVKAERDYLRGEACTLKVELEGALLRAERAEARLHELTLAIAEVSRQAVLAPQRSTVTEVMIEGKKLLQLGNPVGFGRKRIEHAADQ